MTIKFNIAVALKRTGRIVMDGLEAVAFFVAVLAFVSLAVASVFGTVWSVTFGINFGWQYADHVIAEIARHAN